MSKGKKKSSAIELVLEEARKRTQISKIFELSKFCFPAQLNFVSGAKRFRTACTSRRAGKTTALAAKFFHICQTEKNAICLYVTQTSRNARNILWGDLKRIADEYSMQVKTDDTRMTMKFLDTGSEIRLGGAKDESQIENYRGWKLRIAVVDEAQSFRPYLTYFIDDILLPALRDLRGELLITGTPGPIPAGSFYDYTHSETLEHYHWDAFQNPHMKDLEITLTEERAMKGIDETDPGYIRETYGKWVYDPNSLVFKFQKNKNIYKKLPDSELQYVLGIDIGFNDADAIAVLGYSLTEKRVYLVEEVIKDKQDITSLVESIKKLSDKYKPVRMVMDAGALGKKIQEEIRHRHGVHIEAADKNRKIEFIELLNDDLRTGKFLAYENSVFEQDCYLVQWDRSEPTKPVISDTYHTDIGDSVLYAWRECRHFLAEKQVQKPGRDDSKWADYAEEQAMEKWERGQRKSDLEIDQSDIDEIYKNE